MKRLSLPAVVAAVCVLCVVVVRPGEAGAAAAPGLARPGATRPQIACAYGAAYALQSDGTLWLHNPKLSRVVGCAGGDDDWAALASGAWCDLGLKSDGTLWALGARTQVGSDTHWVSAACGQSHDAAIKSTGTLWTWGANDSGQLGLGDTTARAAPTQITGCWGGDTDWVSVACGHSFTMAIKSNGTLWACGANNAGQLGFGDVVSHTTLARVIGCSGGDSNWVAVACGDAFTVALKSDGSLWTWGDNSWGELGLGDTTPRPSPVRVSGCPGGDNNWATISCGSYHAEAVKSDGSLWGWGANLYGNLGTGNRNECHVPTRVAGCPDGDSDWVAVACDLSHTVALKDSGGLYIWGDSCDWLPEDMIGDLDWTDSMTSIDKVACGDDFTVGVVSGNSLLSWGANAYGQLGDGTTDGRVAPTIVTGCSGGDYNWASAACGRYHTLAVKTDHTLWAWGENGSGQLGYDTTSDLDPYADTYSKIPQQVGTDNHWAAVAARMYHSAAVKSDGTLWTWGQNNYGQLGDGTLTFRFAPVQVTGCADGDTNWVAVACGAYHTIALKSDGTLWAFGLNDLGQLGDGTTSVRKSPVQVTGCPGGDANWASIACGDKHTVAIKTGGTIWAWGGNFNGSLGYDTTGDLDLWSDVASRIPQKVGTDNRWATVQCGAAVTVARKSDGSLWAWGDDQYGELGQGTHDSAAHPVPARVGTATDWLAGYSVGLQTIVAPASDGCMWAWGRNDSGQLGDQTYAQRDAPVRVPPLLGHDSLLRSWGPRLPRVAGGGAFSVALKSDSTLWAWGNNSAGELGNGTTDTSVHATPSVSAAPTTWKAVACGYEHGAALRGDGSLWTWGADHSGQLGLGDTTARAAPTQVTGCSGGDVNWVAVACGHDYTLALKSDGSLWSWGDNTYGQLGNGGHDSSAHPVPVRVGTGNSWTAIACGWYHAEAVRSDGTLWSWGYNSSGQLGDGTTTERDAPLQITGCPGGDANWVAVAAGEAFTLGLKSNGSVWAWGSNGYGQLADGTTTSHSSPALITCINGDTDWVTVACGATFAAGLKSDGTLWVWGCGTHGQMADGSTGSHNTPVQVSIGSFDNDWTSVTCGAAHALAMKSDGGLWEWGSDSSGQVGDGAQTDRFSPYPTTALDDIWSPPLLGLTSPDLPDSAKWYSDNSPTFTWSIPSDESGISGYSYTFDSSSTAVVDDSIDTTAGSATFPSVADGVHYFHVKERDGADNWSGVADVEVKIDTTAPLTRASGLQSSTSTGWRNASQPVRLAAGDATGGSGLAHIYYTVNTTEQWFTYSGPFTISAQGSHLVTYWSTDNAGNSETPHHVGYVNIDATAPTVAPATLTPAPDAAGWNNGDVAVTINAADTGGAGVQKTQYAVHNSGVWSDADAGNQFTVPGPADHSGDGVHVYDLRALDNAGNVSATGTVSVAVDTIAPQLHLTSLADGQWVRIWDRVSAAPSDEASGIDPASLLYRVDGGPWLSGASVKLKTVRHGKHNNGVHTVDYQVADEAGNSASGSVLVKIDSMAPRTTDDAPTTTVTTPITVTLTPLDAGCGVLCTWWTLGDGVWQSGTSVPLTPPSSGTLTQTITYYSVDDLGNTERFRSASVTLAAP